MTLLELGQLGQLLSGIGFIITASIAVATYFLFHRKQLDDSWLERFRTLYGEFWNNKDLREIRKYIVNNEDYDVVKKLLSKHHYRTEMVNFLQDVRSDHSEKPRCLHYNASFGESFCSHSGSIK
jgi:hypothetical protein